jgi:hypothetical protein
VRLRNVAYTIIFTPSFRVRGVRRSTAETTKALIETLKKKGVLAPEDSPQVPPPPQPNGRSAQP